MNAVGSLSPAMRQSSGALLLACLALLSIPARADEAPTDRLDKVVATSACAKHAWSHGQGRAPASYLKGVARVFGRAVCQKARADVVVVSSAGGASGTDFERSDALTWYEPQFRANKMSNDIKGLDPLRHTYALLISLGMQESSGRTCVGRDTTQNFKTSDSAEAGLLQTSWGAHVHDASMKTLFDTYKADQSGCWKDVFSWPKMRCSKEDAKTWGDGDGAAWQQLTKACPAFAVEYGAVVMRKNGGGKGEFGPLRKRSAELEPSCDAMLAEVQDLAETTPQLCDALK